MRIAHVHGDIARTDLQNLFRHELDHYVAWLFLIRYEYVDAT